MFERSHNVPNQKKKDHATYYYNRSRCFEYKNLWDSCIVAIRKSQAYHDSADFEARAKLYRRLYKAEKHLNHMDHACLYADSAMKFTDKNLEERQRDDLKNITERYQHEKYESDLRLQRTHWLVVVLVVIVVFGLLFVGQMFRNKHKMIGLQRRMESLNLRVVREEQVKKQASASSNTQNPSSTTPNPSPDTKQVDVETTEWTEEKEENLSMLYLEQFKVSREIFQARPAYSKIRQLKYHTDKNYLPDEERLPLIDSILEVFIDQLQKLVTTYPELTEDECIYALLIFIGCNNATASIITKTSEATLRKRRSRFKQKTNEQVFNLFMGGL
jgi:Sec-independent protein translocase protein TatA